MVMARKVKVGVVGQVAVGRLVRGRLIADAEVVVLAPAVGDGHIERARVVLLAVRADAMQLQAVGMLTLDRRHRPHLLAEADPAAVQVVLSVVQRELIFHTIKRKAARGDAVAVAADGIAHAAVVREVAAEIVKAQRHVAEISVLVRDDNVGHDAAVVDQADGGAAPVGHGILRHGLTVRQPAEGLGRNHCQTLLCWLVGSCYLLFYAGTAGCQALLCPFPLPASSETKPSARSSTAVQQAAPSGA